MLVDTNRPTDGFLFYASTLDVIEEYPEEAQWKLALTVLDFAFHNEADGVFECSDEEYLALHHCFIGITQEKKRYALKLRLDSIRQQLESVEPSGATGKAVQEKMIRNLQKIESLGKKNPDSVSEIDIYEALSPEVYALVVRPALLRKGLLQQLREDIQQAPTERREILTKELDDLVNFAEKLYPVSPAGVQKEKTASAQAKPAPNPEPVKMVGKYAMWAKMSPEERAAQKAPKPDAKGSDSPSSKPFQCQDFEWDKMAMTAKSPLFTSFD